ncbi:MAG: histidine phosphatase family protein [Candidatus Paceibacterota bacterium]|jgi:broad specificity phosphatase PhoE
MSSESIPVKQEQAPQLLARVTFSRHEETEYTGVGRDITEQGIARAQEKGKVIIQEKGAPMVIGHSPRERAKGTAESIEEGIHEELGETVGKARWMRIPGLRSTDYRDEAFLEQLSKELGTGQEAWTDAHYNMPAYYDNPEKVETNEEKRTRLYREIDRLVSFMEKKDMKGEVPHLVFVSHYELLSLLLDDVFGIETFGTTNTPTFGEHIDIDLYKPLPSGDVPIRIHYGGHEKEVLFDRKLRRLVAKPA